MASSCFSPVDRDLGIATLALCQLLAGASHSFSPVDRDLGIATCSNKPVQACSFSFQSRRPGFGDCDLNSNITAMRWTIGFSPVDRDLGIATAIASFWADCIDWFQSRRPGFGDCDFDSTPQPSLWQGFSPVDRDLGIATRAVWKESYRSYRVSVP